MTSLVILEIIEHFVWRVHELWTLLIKSNEKVTWKLWITIGILTKKTRLYMNNVDSCYMKEQNTKTCKEKMVDWQELNSENNHLKTFSFLPIAKQSLNVSSIATNASIGWLSPTPSKYIRITVLLDNAFCFSLFTWKMKE